jgi:hypothetical protein
VLPYAGWRAVRGLACRTRAGVPYAGWRAGAGMRGVRRRGGCRERGGGGCGGGHAGVGAGRSSGVSRPTRRGRQRSQQAHALRTQHPSTPCLNTRGIPSRFPARREGVKGGIPSRPHLSHAPGKAPDGVADVQAHPAVLLEPPHVPAGPGHGIPGHGIPGHGIPGHGIPGHGIPGHGIPGPADPSPGRGNVSTEVCPPPEKTCCVARRHDTPCAPAACPSRLLACMSESPPFRVVHSPHAASLAGPGRGPRYYAGF